MTERFRYDGHGLNRASGTDRGERVLTFAKHPERDGGGYICADAERDRLGALFAAAPELRDALCVVYLNHAHRAYLQANDPKALEQIERALKLAMEG